MASPQDNAAPDMSVVPSALKERSLSADQMVKALQEGRDPYAAPEPQDAPQTPESKDRGQDTPAEREAAPEPQDRTQQGVEDDRPTHPSRQPRHEAREDRREDQTDKGEDFAQKYRSLQGSYNGLMERYKQSLTDNENLRAVISTMEMGGSGSDGTDGEGEYDPGSLMSDEEKDQWGPDFVDLLRRVNKPLADENKKLKSQLNGVRNNALSDGRAKMMATIAERVPNWAEVNEAQDFNQWLALTDEASGQQRKKLIMEAFQRNEGARVAHFFNRFLQEVRGQKPQADTSTDKGTQREPADKSQNGLERFAAPGKAKGAAAPKTDGNEPAIISVKEISKFYADKAMGKWRGREKEADAFEQKIFKAQQENRVQ